MKTLFKKSFLRDVKKIRNRAVREAVKHAILAVEAATTPDDIPELKKLKGTKNGLFFRIKVNDYRIGITIENCSVTFVICDKRKDIYKYFP
jgi:mRNA interferase RelE/StbE